MQAAEPVDLLRLVGPTQYAWWSLLAAERHGNLLANPQGLPKTSKHVLATWWGLLPLLGAHQERIEGKDRLSERSTTSSTFMRTSGLDLQGEGKASDPMPRCSGAAAEWQIGGPHAIVLHKIAVGRVMKHAECDEVVPIHALNLPKWKRTLEAPPLILK